MAIGDWLSSAGNSLYTYYGQNPDGTPDMGFSPQGLNLIAMLGKMGAGMLQGTDKQWLGMPGAVASEAVGGMALGRAQKDQSAYLQHLLANPNIKGVTMKPDGTINATGEAAKPPDPWMRQSTTGAQPTATSQLATAGDTQLGNYLGNPGFLRALLQTNYSL